MWYACFMSQTDPDETTCTCETYDAEHTCPFKVEIHDDTETLCTCCSHCEYQCAMDI